MLDKKRIERVLVEFDWYDYGLDDVSSAIEEAPESQEWIPDLASKIIETLQEQIIEALQEQA